MSVALFIESTAENGTDKVQTLLAPTPSGVINMYGRISTGGRGKSEHWKLTNLSELPNTPINKQPVAVRLTNTDMEGLRHNKVTTIAIKAISFLDVSPTGIGTHREVVEVLLERLRSQDSSLSEYILDSRISNKPIVFDTFTPTVTQPITAPVQAPATTYVPDVALASVPDRKWATTYINRVVGGRSEFDVFDIARRNGENVLIKGHAGSGKTMSVLAYASANNLPYYSLSSTAGTSIDHFFGHFVPDPVTGGFRWLDGAVTTLCRYGGVLLINEINFLAERISSALFSLLDDRREIQLLDKDGEVIKAHPNLLIVGDMNPNYRGTRDMNKAFSERFKHVLEYPYDEKIEQKLIKNKGVLTMANQLRERFEQGEITTPISTRSLVGLVDNVTNLGLEYALYSYLNHFPDGVEREAVKLVLETHQTAIEEGF